MTQRHLVKTRHGYMHVRVTGEGGAGRPLVLFHSQLVGGRWFEDIVPLLADGRRVVVHDRLGYGASDPAPRPLSFAEYADATLEALAGVGVDEFDALGMHTGCVEVVELALRAPSKVVRAIMLSVPVRHPSKVAEARANYAVPPPPPAPDGSHLEWYWNWWLCGAPPKVPLSTIQGWMVDHLAASPDYWWTFEAAIGYPTMERLPDVKQPLLSLTPHDDAVDPKERGAALPKHAESIDLPHITNVGTVLTLHRHEIAQIVNDYLGKDIA